MTSIRRSYRNRGSVARSQIITNTKKIPKPLPIKWFLKLGKKNKYLVSKDKIKIMPYSAIKIIANFTEPYSILNPDTSSDSPSAKSKGVRFNSAVQLMTQGRNNKSAGATIPDRFKFKLPEDKLEDFHVSIMAPTINANLIS